MVFRPYSRFPKTLRCGCLTHIGDVQILRVGFAFTLPHVGIPVVVYMSADDEQYIYGKQAFT